MWFKLGNCPAGRGKRVSIYVIKHEYSGEMWETSLGYPAVFICLDDANEYFSENILNDSMCDHKDDWKLVRLGDFVLTEGGSE